MRNFLKHLRMVVKHKWFVFKFCYKCGIPKLGLLHDMSKFSITELCESIIYVNDNRSPIDVAKEINGYSLAWLHHLGRNKHHWGYWIDWDTKGELFPVEMPAKYAVEMICDYLGAGCAYNSKGWSYKEPLRYWIANRHKIIVHENTEKFIHTVFMDLYKADDKETISGIFKEISIAMKELRGDELKCKKKK